MKKSLVIIPLIPFLIITLTKVPNTSAASISEQSINVTVGEVDIISTNDEKNINNEGQEIHVPKTGLFGLKTNDVSTVVITSLIIPTIIVILWALKKHPSISHKIT